MRFPSLIDVVTQMVPHLMMVGYWPAVYFFFLSSTRSVCAWFIGG